MKSICTIEVYRTVLKCPVLKIALQCFQFDFRNNKFDLTKMTHKGKIVTHNLWNVRCHKYMTMVIMCTACV